MKKKHSVAFGRSQIEDHFSESMVNPRPPLAMINSQEKKAKNKTFTKKKVGAIFFVLIFQNFDARKVLKSCTVDLFLIIASGEGGERTYCRKMVF